ncbi:MAG: ankyrin repeat domain-containing protein, partial [Spirochaetes bacterium]|nr:ankyrin repeat domain-containing protein [Spirochaetota bacterium]
MIQRIHAIAIGLLLFSCASAPKKIETGPNADLLRAAAAGNSTLVEQAIMAGGDAQVRDERGRTPLMLAASAGNLETLKILLQPKATVAAKKSRREGVAIIHYLNNTGSKNNTWIGASLPDAIEGLMAENFDFKRS